MPTQDSWGRSLATITALNRFARSEDAGIKPGEDANDLMRRTSYRRPESTTNRTASPNAAHRAPRGVPDRLKTARRGSDVHPPRQSSSSSEFSNYSNGSGSNASSNAGSFSAESSTRRSATYRALPYHINDPGRIAHQHRLSSVSDASEAEPPLSSEFKNYWQSPPLFPFAEKGRATTTTESVMSSSVASHATTSTKCTSLLDSEMPVSVPHHDCQPHHSDTNAMPTEMFITESPPFSPNIVIPNPLDSYPTSSSINSKAVAAKITEITAGMSRESSSQGQAMDNGTTQASPYEHDEMADSNATIQRHSDSGASNEEPDTPTSEQGNSDGASSGHEDSESLSDDSHDALQTDFLEGILRPVKHQLVERLMVYVASNPDLNVPLSPTLPRFEIHQQKNEIASPISELLHLGSSPEGRKGHLKYEVLEENQDDSTKETSLAVDPKGTQHSPGQASQRPTTSRGYGQNTSTTKTGPPNHSNSRAGKKRKSARGGPPQGNDDDGDDDEDERFRAPKSRRSQSPQSPKRRIACPYFQRSPMRTAKADSCFRNGFLDITKMKEHLERVHDNSIQCPRCYEIFKKQDQLDDHLRVSNEEMCVQTQVRPVLEGYNSTQASKLKERMRSCTVEAKWQTIWKILFPSDAEHDIPSPWWDPTRRPDFFGRYEEFQRDDLPRRITPRIMAFVDFLLADDRLRGNIDATVLTALEESLEVFKSREAAGQLAPRGGEAGSSATGNGPGNAGPSFTGGPATVSLVQMQRDLDVWGPAQGDADVDFGEAVVAPPQGVHMPYRVVAAPAINEPEPAHAEVNNDYQNVDASFLNVETGGSAMHTPPGHTSDGQWDSIEEFTSLYEDVNLVYDTQASHGGNA